MKLIAPGYKILYLPQKDSLLNKLEKYGRICYKSENKITTKSAYKFVNNIIKKGHLSIIEHMIITIRFICDRGISHELVRHRLASYTQESTRYVNYSNKKNGKEITFIRPIFWLPNSKEYTIWLESMKEAEKQYLALINYGAQPEEARNILPHSLKTEIIITANLREWRHILKLRSSKTAHPQCREIMLPLLAELNKQVPIIFEDLYETLFQDIETIQKVIATWNKLQSQLQLENIK